MNKDRIKLFIALGIFAIAIVVIAWQMLGGPPKAGTPVGEAKQPPPTNTPAEPEGVPEETGGGSRRAPNGG